jgi:type II secretory pathway component PulC
LAVVLAAGSYFAWLESKDEAISAAAVHDDVGHSEKKADLLVAEILKRPLFTEGRQPPRPRIVKAEPPKLQGRLAGVMLRSDLREALFTRPGGRPVAVKEGQVIDGWTTSRIEAGQVVLTSSFGEQIVKLTNGSPDEMTPGRRPVKKAPPKKPQPATAGQPPALAQRPQQLAVGGRQTGQ